MRVDIDPRALEDLVEFLSLLSGFGLFIATVPNGRVGAALGPALARELARAPEPVGVQVLDPYEDGTEALGREQLIARVGDTLLDGAPGDAAPGVVLINASRSTPLDRKEWLLFFAWLNRVRDRVGHALGRPLVMVLTPDMHADFAKHAPDFWSMRRDVVSLGAEAPWEELLGAVAVPGVEAMPPRGRILFESTRNALLRQDRATIDALEPELRRIQRMPQGDALGPGAAPHWQLEELLLALFPTGAELRHILARSFGPGVVVELPSELASTRVMARDAVAVLRRRELVPSFLRLLFKQFPTQRTEVQAVLDAFGMVDDSPTAKLLRSSYAAFWLAEIELRRGELSRALTQLAMARTNLQELLDDAPDDAEARSLLAQSQERLVELRGLGRALARHGAPIHLGLKAIGEERSMAETREVNELLRFHQGDGSMLQLNAALTADDDEAAGVESYRRGAPLVILASFNPDEVLPGTPHTLRVYAAPERRGDWERVVGHRLHELRESMRELEMPHVRLLPRCVLSVGMRAGLVFHNDSGFAVRCLLTDEAKGGLEEWDLDLAPQPIACRTRVTARPDAREIHALVSINHDLASGWDRRGEPRDASRVEISLAGGPNRSARLTVGEALGVAEQLRQALAELPPTLPVRLTLAGPVGLAVALGRTFIQPRPLTLMDFDARTGSYVESFVCQAGD